ncbi:MAG: transglycosylase domain-containing protein [Thermodesulfobacteriota bacterium]
MTPRKKTRITRSRSSLMGRVMGFWFAGVPVLVVLALAAGMGGAGLGAYLVVSKDLPAIPDLRGYRPKTVSTFYALDGTVMAEFYRERRYPLPYEAIPAHVRNAFVAVEDARFFTHPGVDLPGVIRALVKCIKAGDYVAGGSTITQQLTRNLLLTQKKTMGRKIREALLSYRLEQNLSKEQILNIYLNEIYLGTGAYGVEGAARTYFDKSCRDLTISEAALIAGLTASPTKFAPGRNLEGAIHRRDIVLAAMLKNGFISEQQHEAAVRQALHFKEEPGKPAIRAPYFTETVRQYIVDHYGESVLYDEGLQVWTTCDLSMQDRAEATLKEGVMDWEKRQRRPAGLVKRLTKREAKEFLGTKAKEDLKAGDRVQAVVLANEVPKDGRNTKKKHKAPTVQNCTCAMPGDVRFEMQFTHSNLYRPNDLLEFRVADVRDGKLILEHQPTPPVQGAVVSIENRTGYVRALVGGLDFDRSPFNRATQALRQPGSSFKPFVYAAALEWRHYGPNTVVVDEPIMVLVNRNREEWVPSNADGRFMGPLTLRQALALSRNTATVKLLMDVGPDAAIRMARNAGISARLGKHLSLSLGVSEVTPLELTAAYTVFANMGTRVQPVMVRKVKDRFGRILEDNTVEPLEITPESIAQAAQERVEAATAAVDAQPQDQDEQEETDLESAPEDMPEQQTADSPATRGRDSVLEMLHSGLGKPVRRVAPPTRVMSPQTAYLMADMLREVCVSGTAAAAGKLKRNDLAGKTGTTDDCSDAWFVGFDRELTTGAWIGYDTKTSLGRNEHGSTAALPVWMRFVKGTTPRGTGQLPIPQGIVFGEPNQTQWGGGFPQQSRQERQGPDLAPEFQTMQVCRIDESDASVGGYDGYGPPMVANAPAYPGASPQGFPQPGGFFQPGPYGEPSEYYPQQVRVLSEDGQTIGYAPYQVDDRGRMSVARDQIAPVTPDDDAYSAGDPNAHGLQDPRYGNQGLPGQRGLSYGPGSFRFPGLPGFGQFR